MIFYSVSDWLEETKQSVHFEDKSPDALAALLRRFYGEARSQEGKRYSHSTMRGLRASINRYLRSPPHNRKVDIVHDREYIQANQVFDGYIVENKKEGLDKTKHKSPIDDADWKKLHGSDYTKGDTPETLQNSFFLNMMTHFGRRGREGLRRLKKQSFLLKRDPTGRKYVEESCNELTKNHQTSTEKDETITDRLMWEQPGDPRCPIATFEEYIRRLDPNTDTLFTYPLSEWKESEIWFSSKPLGENKLGSKMKQLSEKAGLSEVYTNHCLRATVVTRLSRQGVDPIQICRVTGHKNISSIKHYMGKPSLGEKAKISHLLHSDEPATNNIQATLGAMPSALGGPPKALRDPPAALGHPEALGEEAALELQANAQPLAATITNRLNNMPIFSGAIFHGATININWNI